MDKYMYRYISVRSLYSPNKIQRQNGSTIIEAIVAIFVLSFGVLALMLAQITAVQTSINAANQAEVTRAVQNYVELMNSQSKISLEETKDKDENKIFALKKDFSDFNDADCSKDRIKINLINSKVNECRINNGQITVTWRGQTLNKDDKDLDNKNLFSYSLTAGQS